MFKELVNKLKQAKTLDEILSYKSQIKDTYSNLYEHLCDQGLCITNYEDIKTLHNLNYPMMAYYGPTFYSECGIPFLKKYNTSTLDVIEIAVLFYSLQICELLENGFLKNEIEGIQELDSQDYLFAQLWYLFMEVITIKDGESKLTVCYENKSSELYVPDEKYEEILDLLYKNYCNSKYSNIVKRILGIYRIRFTKMLYVLKYQPLFVEVGYRYLCSV